MPAPTIKVEFGFGSTWQTEPGSITWTDVTSYVLQPDRLVAQRGAGSARGRVDVGSCGFSLKNDDRRFDPTYTSSPYNPNLKPGVPVRVTGTPSGGSSAAVWYGSVARWPQRYDLGDSFAWVPVECFDGFDKLSRAKIPRSLLEKEILADSPIGYWKLDEQSGTLIRDSSSNGRHGSYESGATGLSKEFVINDDVAMRGIDFVPGYGSLVPNTAAVPSVSDFSAEVIVEVDGATARGMIVRTDDGRSRGFALTMNNAGAAERYVALYKNTVVDGGQMDQVALSTDINSTYPTIPNGLHHIFVSSDNTIVIDGVDRTFAPAVASIARATPGVTIGGFKHRGFSALGDRTGLVASLALYAKLSNARQVVHANAALVPLDGQTTDQRISWILDELDWPTNLRDLETGRTVLGPATFKPGDEALEYLRLVTISEDGLLFCGKDGKLRFLDRYWRYLNTSATTSQFTFTDQNPNKGYAEYDLDLDDDLLVNVCRVTRRNGTEQIASKSSSVASHGEAELVLTDLVVPSDADARSLAEWTVATRGTALPRVPKIRVPLHRYSAADQATVLGLDLGYRVTVNRTPQGVGSAISLDFVVDGIRHEVGSGEWWTELFVSPVPQDTVNLLLWDTGNWDDNDAVWAY